MNYPKLLSVALLSIVIGCKQSNSDNITPADSSCQVQTTSTVVVESGSTNTYTKTQAFSYDAKGQLTSVVTSNTYSSGSPGGRTTQAYTYDNDGYQTAYKSVYSYTGQGDETYNYGYEYANGRLTKQTTQSTSDYFESAGTTAYTYDATGGLTQSLDSYTYKFNLGGTKTTTITSYTNSFANGVPTGQKGLVDGKPTTATYTAENGRITSETYSSGLTVRYTYDANGNQTKQETLNATGTVTSSIAKEYGSTAAPKSVFPIQKGFPVSAPYYGNDNRIVTRITTTSGGQPSLDYQYQSQLNSKGYPAKVVSTNVLTKGTQTTTYAYSNCQ